MRLLLPFDHAAPHLFFFTLETTDFSLLTPHFLQHYLLKMITIMELRVTLRQLRGELLGLLHQLDDEGRHLVQGVVVVAGCCHCV